MQHFNVYWRIPVEWRRGTYDWQCGDYGATPTQWTWRRGTVQGYVAVGDTVHAVVLTRESTLEHAPLDELGVGLDPPERPDTEK